MKTLRSFLCVAGGVLAAACDGAPSQPSGPEYVPGAPPGWSWDAGRQSAYSIGTDRRHVYSGGAAANISGTAPSAQLARAQLSQLVRADAYRGQRVRWSAWLNAAAIDGAGVALWMSIDGPGETQGFDDMSGRMVLRTSGWERLSVVLDVPSDAIGISLGLYVVGSGELLVDDFALEVVGNTVAVTNLLTGHVPTGVDPADVEAAYARSRAAPVNLDFEGLGGMVATAAAWLSSVAVPLAATQPGAALTDLAPLRSMVGTARIVGMGEGTHGTREFFELKHRVFEFLVREMGFTHFAIEATWSEADDINNYVLTGQGDPARLLSRLYFWTWNTEEVLALIQWMRQWNLTAPASRRVQFLGFDIQYPGAAMDSVASFIGRVDSARASYVADRYACIAPYRNNGSAFSRPQSTYAALPQAEREACSRSLAEVAALIRADSVAYSSASSDSAYSRALHSARAVQQFEEMASASGSAYTAVLVRDRCMAENVQWLMQQAGPAARMMLWAHNGHVASMSGWMGGELRNAYGGDYLNLGFIFGTGSFNARGSEATGNTSVRAFDISLVPEGSLESVFMATDRPLLLLDARRIASGGSAAALLAGPIAMRTIGAVYNPASEAITFAPTMLPSDYQLLMYVRSATASVLLPSVQ